MEAHQNGEEVATTDKGKPPATADLSNVSLRVSEGERVGDEVSFRRDKVLKRE